MFPILVLTFGLQAALVVLALYAVVLLGDLERDFINPHDCSRKLNRLVLPQLVLLGLETLAFFFLGRWLVAAVYGEAPELLACAIRILTDTCCSLPTQARHSTTSTRTRRT
jgi:hypothetical protein